MPLTDRDHELLETLETQPGTDFWMLDQTVREVAALRHDKIAWARAVTAANKEPRLAVRAWIEAVDDVATRRNGHQDQAGSRCDPFAFTDAAAIMSTDVTPRRWLIPGIIADGLTLLGGSPKGGKTYLAYSLALAVATDGLWCGHWHPEAGKVVYISLEDDSDDTHLRINELLPQAALKPGQLLFLHGADALPSFSDGLIAWMEEAIALHHPRLMIIDPISYLYVLKKNGNQFEETKDMLVPLRELAKSQHCALVCLEHRRKRSRDDVLMVDTLYGSVVKQAVADGIIMVNRDHEDIELDMTIRYGQEQKVYIKFTFENGRCFLNYTGAAAGTENYGDLRTRVLNALRQAPMPMTIGDLLHELTLSDTRQVRQNLSQILYRGTKTREVEKLARGRFMLGDGEA